MIELENHIFCIANAISSKLHLGIMRFHLYVECKRCSSTSEPILEIDKCTNVVVGCSSCYKCNKSQPEKVSAIELIHERLEYLSRTQHPSHSRTWNDKYKKLPGYVSYY